MPYSSTDISNKLQALKCNYEELLSMLSENEKIWGKDIASKTRKLEEINERLKAENVNLKAMIDSKDSTIRKLDANMSSLTKIIEEKNEEIKKLKTEVKVETKSESNKNKGDIDPIYTDLDKFIEALIALD